MSAPNQTIQNTSNPAEYAAAVTLSDSTVLTPTPRALYIGVGGDVVVTMAADGSDVTFKNVPTGTKLPVRVSMVKATGTTASSIVALY